MPEPLFILGPFSMYPYGVMIAVGLLVTLGAVRIDQRCRRLLTEEQLSTFVMLMIISGFIGGKLFHLIAHRSEITSWYSSIQNWNEGFWVSGSFVACCATGIFYFLKQRLPVIELMDRFSLYVPLLLSIARLGCFFSGCCYGLETTCWLAIKGLHPTQLYSSGIEFFIFIVLYVWGQLYLKKPGQLFSCSFMLMSLERFFVDFFRGDRILFSAFLSFPQVIAALMVIVSFSFFIVATWTSFLDVKGVKRKMP